MYHGITSKFQSTLPRRSDDVDDSLQGKCINFNPRSREGATAGDCKIVDSGRFQSTLPRRSDVQTTSASSGKSISIHAPAKERLQLFRQFMIRTYFNPRSREGATRFLEFLYSLTVISIHAPAKERLSVRHLGFRYLPFQSTLPRRSDWDSSQVGKMLDNFNPRSREGATASSSVMPSNLTFQSTLPRRSDSILRLQSSDFPISIHAPAKERRGAAHRSARCGAISIHAPAKERPICAFEYNFPSIFQSTLPRRSDRSGSELSTYSVDFNPRSREGATREDYYGPEHQKNFNPRSREGATNGRRLKYGYLKFQSTLPRRSDDRVVRDAIQSINFNPRSREGATNYSYSLTELEEISIHAPAKERPIFCACVQAAQRFQSTLPRRSDSREHKC